jgi:hypothetical protein
MSRRRTGAGSPVELQFAIEYAMPRDRSRRMTRAVLEEVVHYWIENGESPDGFEVKPIAWVHKNRITGADDEEKFRAVLGRLLQAGTTVSLKIRGHEGV